MATDSINESFETSGVLPNHFALEHSEETANERTEGQPPVVLARIPRLVENLAGANESESALSYTVDPPHRSNRHPQQHSSRTDRRRRRSSQLSRSSMQQASRSQATSSPMAYSQSADIPSNDNQQRSDNSAMVSATGVDLASRLCQLHSGMAPYAGVIVALALIASAGLLYWMVTGPTSTPQGYQDNFGQEEYGIDAFGQFSLEWADAESQTDNLQPANSAVETNEIVTDSSEETWLQTSTRSSQLSENMVAESEVHLLPSGDDILPKGNSTEPQPEVNPIENNIYPTTKYAPIDFVEMEASGEARVARRELKK